MKLRNLFLLSVLALSSLASCSEEEVFNSDLEEIEIIEKIEDDENKEETKEEIDSTSASNSSSNSSSSGSSSSSSSSSSNSRDADSLDPYYALGAEDKYYEADKDMVRGSYYSSLDLFNNVKVGDLFYEKNNYGDIEHVGIVENIQASSDFGPLIRTIEAVGSKVQYCYIDDNRFIENNSRILRLESIGDSQINDVLTFAKTQLGKPYSFDLHRANNSVNSESRYCSELIYAAFLSIGLDFTIGTHYQAGNCILPPEIYESSLTSEIWLTKKFLSFEALQKSRHLWNIRISNSNSSKIANVSYNRTTTSQSNAINYSSLERLQVIDEIDNENYKDVNIYENREASNIVASFVDKGVRVTTIANSLDASNKSMNIWFKYQRA